MLPANTQFQTAWQPPAQTLGSLLAYREKREPGWLDRMGHRAVTRWRSWLSPLKHLQARAQTMRIKATDYLLGWLVRTHLIVEMRHAGIDRLKLQQDWGQHEVAKALVPDMNNWVSMWIKRAGNSLNI
jgi:hypothetical protein